MEPVEEWAVGRPSAALRGHVGGYADESHLDREFRSLAGASPRRWLAEELRNVQVPRTAELAPSTA